MDLHYENIISKDGVYSIVWSGTYNGKSCAIKMILLETSDKTNMPSKNDPIPFLHTEFQNRKLLTILKFQREIDNLKRYQSLGLTPSLYTSWTTKTKSLEYGFIVMEKLQFSLKDIVLSRSLHSNEKHIVDRFIHSLEKHDLIHGDLKPANIGVVLDNKTGLICSCKMLDCQKTFHKSELLLNSHHFKKTATKDRRHFRRHFRENKRQRNKK